MAIGVNRIGPSQGGMGKLMSSPALRIGKMGAAVMSGDPSNIVSTTAQNVGRPGSRASQLGGAAEMASSFGGSSQTPSPGMQSSNNIGYDPSQNQPGALGAPMQFQTDPSMNQPDPNDWFNAANRKMNAQRG